MMRGITYTDDPLGTVRILYDDEQHIHSKATERYVDVTFEYADGTSWTGWVPIEYRRTGTDLTTIREIEQHLMGIAAYCNPVAWPAWRAAQDEFWQTKPKAIVTKGFFDALEGTLQWTCVDCDTPTNRNFAKRVQQLKEYGYTIATDTGRYCSRCGKSQTHLLLIPIPREGISGYETWPAGLRKRIIATLGAYDVFEARSGHAHGLLPDHKFPEIRWDARTRRESLADLGESDIPRDFQLLSNQRNQQKREVCRRYFQTGKRGYPFGLKFYYEGGEDWPEDTPKTGKAAEQGCVGCGWYDMERWRTALNRSLGSAVDAAGE